MLLSFLTPVRSQTWGNPSGAYLKVNSVDLNGGGSHISVSPGDTLSIQVTGNDKIAAFFIQQAPNLQVRLLNVFDSASSLQDLGVLISNAGSPLDDIVVVTSTTDRTLQDASINFSPSNALVVLGKNKHDIPLQWISEVKSVALKETLKDEIYDVVLTLSIMTVCATAGALPPPVDEAELYACANLKAVQATFGWVLADWLRKLDMTWLELIDPTIKLDSVTIVYGDGSQGTVSADSLKANALRFPTILSTIDTLLSQSAWWGQVVTAHSPVTLLITDSRGRRVGETTDGQILSEIPNGLFVPRGLVYLSWAISNYSIQLTGSAEGNYELVVALAAIGSSSLDSHEFSGSISTGQSVTYSVTSSNNQVSVSPTNKSRWGLGSTGTIILSAAITAVAVLLGSKILFRRRRRR